MRSHSEILKALIGLFISIYLCGCQTKPVGVTIPFPRTFIPSEVTGRWIGFTPSNTDLYMLDLRADNAGLLTKAYWTNTVPSRYEISRWSISTDVLTCTFAEPDANAPYKTAQPVKMKCQITGDRLEATLQNDEGGWKVNIFFMPEKDFANKLEVLQQ